MLLCFSGSHSCLWCSLLFPCTSSFTQPEHQYRKGTSQCARFLLSMRDILSCYFLQANTFPLEELEQRGVHCTRWVWKEQISLPVKSCEESCSLAVLLDNAHNCLCWCIPGMILSVQRAAQVQRVSRAPFHVWGPSKELLIARVLCCTWCCADVHRDLAALEYSLCKYGVSKSYFHVIGSNICTNR